MNDFHDYYSILTQINSNNTPDNASTRGAPHYIGCTHCYEADPADFSTCTREKQQLYWLVLAYYACYTFSKYIIFSFYLIAGSGVCLTAHTMCQELKIMGEHSFMIQGEFYDTH